MKKIIILLFSAGAFATSFAQYNHGQNNGDDEYLYNNRNYDQRRFGNNGIFPARERDFQIEKINREFDYKIQSVQHSHYMNRREKKAAIKSLKTERLRQIQFVNARYNNNRNNNQRWNNKRHRDDHRNNKKNDWDKRWK